MLEFADDVKLFRAIVDISDIDKLQNVITALAAWCKGNNLVLNPSETKDFFLLLRENHFLTTVTTL